MLEAAGRGEFRHHLGQRPVRTCSDIKGEQRVGVLKLKYQDSGYDW